MRCSRQEIKENEFLFCSDTFSADQRFESCLKWYIRKACFYKLVFYIFTFTGAICPIVVAALNNVTLDAKYMKYMQLALTVLSVAASVSAIILATVRAQEKWTRYRSAAENLKRERSLYLERKKLGKEDSEEEFVNNIEEYMKQENQEWRQNNVKKQG